MAQVRSEFKEDVEAAAKMLDATVDDWPVILTAKYGKKLRDLEVSDHNKCVLSATHGTFRAGLEALEIAGYGRPDVLDTADVVADANAATDVEDFWRRGRAFACFFGQDAELRRLWLAEVEKRRAPNGGTSASK